MHNSVGQLSLRALLAGQVVYQVRHCMEVIEFGKAESVEGGRHEVRQISERLRRLRKKPILDGHNLNERCV